MAAKPLSLSKGSERLQTERRVVSVDHDHLVTTIPPANYQAAPL
jgi:hypothetical protein